MANSPGMWLGLSSAASLPIPQYFEATHPHWWPGKTWPEVQVQGTNTSSLLLQRSFYSKLPDRNCPHGQGRGD